MTFVWMQILTDFISQMIDGSFGQLRDRRLRRVEDTRVVVNPLDIRHESSCAPVLQVFTILAKQPSDSRLIQDSNWATTWLTNSRVAKSMGLMTKLGYVGKCSRLTGKWKRSLTFGLQTAIACFSIRHRLSWLTYSGRFVGVSTHSASDTF